MRYLNIRIIGFVTMLLSSFAMFSCTNNDEHSCIVDLEQNPQLLSFSFCQGQNIESLLEDVKGEIIGDSIVECWIPYIIFDKKLKPKIESLGGAYLDDVEYKPADNRTFDFSHPVKLSIKNESNLVKLYTIYVYTFTGLPMLWIETDNRATITSKEEYIPAKFKLIENVVTKSVGQVTEGRLEIRGRGNSTWTLPKKPYRLKFNDKISFWGEPEDKHWTLLANYYDKTMLRNALAFYMGSISNLDYTPRYHFVELFLNGRYDGTYQFTEALRIGKNRINIGDDGYLLEIDNHLRDYEVSFNTTRIPFPIRIHKPEVTVGDADYEFIREFVQKAEDVLYSESYLDESDGYDRYIDIDSFAEWYVISEILENAEAAGTSYLTLSRGGKLKAGPLWDFDLSIANNPFARIGQPGDSAHNPYTLFVKPAMWYPQLFKDRRFIEQVKKRFDFFYERKLEIYEFINEGAHYLKRSAIENNNRWGMLYAPASSSTLLDVWGSYQNEVQYIKNYLNIRMEWLKSEFDKM